MPSPKVFVSAVLDITCCYSHTLTTIGKKGDLSYIKRGMVLGAKCTGLSISETKVNVNALRKNALLVPDVRGERPDYFSLSELE